MRFGADVTILTPRAFTATPVYICFIAVERPDGTWHWKKDLTFYGEHGYENVTGWDAAAQRRGLKRHIITAELPPI